jgi:hypothetical protein
MGAARGVCAFGLAVAMGATAVVAHAEPDARPPSALVPPSPVETTAVPYPKDAQGDAKVVLALILDDEGNVVSATVDAGDEPFASAAANVATGWRFTPATRDGRPIASRIRYEVAFVDARGDDTTPARADATVPGARADAPGAAIVPSDVSAPIGAVEVALEVDAIGQRLPPAVSSMTRAEVRQLPGAFGDPFRAIEVLPGVTPIVSGLPFFFVRGAPPGNVGYFLDGVRVPYLFHAAAGPSVVHPGLVERVDLYAGGYPARFGRFAGAVVSAETTEPRTDAHGEANLRIVDAGALVEGGFADGRGSALVGGRYSYTAGLFSLISPEITLDYRDFQARVAYDLTSKDRLSLFAFGSYDFLSETTNDIETVVFGSEFYRVDARYDAKLPRGGSLRAATTLGFDQTRVADGRNTRAVLFGSRLWLTQPLDDALTLRAGLDVQHDLYAADTRRFGDPDDPETQSFNRLFPPRNDAVAATFAELVYRVDPRFTFTPGVRLDTFLSNGTYAVSVDPRLSVEVDVTRGVRLLHALGLAHQAPAFVVPVPGLAVANLDGGLQRALQVSSGVELQLPWSTTATVSAFDSIFTNMSDTLSVQPSGANDNQLPRSRGHAYGLEVYVRKSLSSKLGGFVSYTLSRTTRSIDGVTFPAAFDRTHVLNTALGYDLGAGWRAGARWSLFSGSPTLASTSAIDPRRPSSLAREPAYYRLDFRVEKRWKLTDDAWISLVIEMLNATLNTETRNGNAIGPVSIPSIGAEAGF